MATHKSAAVAARQRVNDHLQQQIEALTQAVETGIKATEQLGRIDDDHAELLAQLEQRHTEARADLDTAITGLRDLGKTKPEIAALLDINPKLVTSRRCGGAM